MSPPPPSPIESASATAGPSAAPGPSGAVAWLGEIAAEVARACGVTPLALLAGGSHACGEGVWVEWEGRPVTLSDLDLWAVLPDARVRRAAARRLAAAEPALAAAAARVGVLAPVEVALLTPATLAAMPARPATLELRACGRVIAGDPVWLTRVPDHAPADVPAEERLLLLENRAFELLWAHGLRAAGTPFAALRARHAVLKCALDLATVLALAHGELPMGAAARVGWARERLAGDRTLAPLTGCGFETLWERALAWRAGDVRAGSDAETTAEWHRAVRAWLAVWRHVTGAAGADPVAHALALAARAPWPRRVRRSLAFHPAAAAPPIAERLAAARLGTPQHRLGAAAAVLLVSAAAGAGTEPVLGPSAADALRRLAVTPGGGDWGATARALTHRWDLWVLGGRRGTTAS